MSTVTRQPASGVRNAVSQRGLACIGLYNAKTTANIGSVLRAAYCYDASLVAITGKRYSRAVTDTPAAYRHLPLLHVDDLRMSIPFDCVPVAIELRDDARPLPTYTHPKRAFYVFGPEDGTLGPSILDWCRDVIYIPTRTCMNLAACVNVVLYDRMAKATP